MTPRNKKSSPCQKIVFIDFDKALDDIIRQEIHILQHVKALCPKDFTDRQIELVFDRVEILYNGFLSKIYKDQLKLQQQANKSNEKHDDDVGVA